jgi:membrane-bound serine protease (ClpP class)
VILPIVLVVGSLAVFVLEVFFVSFGALSAIAVALGVFGVALAFGESSAYGWTMLGILIIGIPLVVRVAFKLLPLLPFARGFYLRAPQLTDAERHAAAAPEIDLKDAIGEATSQLRPAGTALFGGRPVQVVTDGTLIERGARVRVIDVTGNRIVVELADPPQEP